jgi:hypothetical protein
MCALLEDKVKKSGKSRILQYEVWKRFFSCDKKGQKFIITEIFAEPKAKIDKRKEGNTNNNKYGKLVQELLMDLLLHNSGKLYEPISFFIKSFYMTNKNYRSCENNIPKLARLLEIDEYYVYEFYNLNRRKFRDIFETALKALAKQNVIRWEKKTVVCISTPNPERNELKELKLQGKGNTFVRVNSQVEHREATEEEIKLVKEAEKKLLSEFGYKNKQQVLFAGKIPEFNRELSKILFDKGNIDYMYYKYRISLNNETGNYELQGDDYEDYRKELNDLLIKNININTEKRHKKARHEYISVLGEIKFKSKSDEYRFSETYIQINLKLVSLLIYWNAKDISSILGK